MKEAENISVLVPVLNESKYLGSLVDSLANQTYPKENMEFIFIDGGSSDDTVDLIVGLSKDYCQRSGLEPEKGFRVLHNKNRTVPFALNLGIEDATNNLIVRLDAHCEYGEDYFERIVETFRSSGADIVGGPTRVASRNPFQAAVGQAICSKFAVGGSRVHQLDYRGESESVTFGAWRKEVFQKTGPFDVRLVRNQDDEFHYRARSKGFTIFQEPTIRLYYYPRDNPVGLFRQYFGYGRYKPLVLKKVKSGIRMRHLVPAGLVCYLISLPLGLVFWWWWIPLAFYLAGLLVSSVLTGQGWKVRLLLLGVYPLIHLGYGLGFLSGLPLAFRST